MSIASAFLLVLIGFIQINVIGTSNISSQYPQIKTTATTSITASTTTATTAATVTEEADEVGVDNRQVSVEVNSQFQEFQETYFSMRNDMKWKLPSGSYVEDIIFNYTKDFPYEWLVLSLKVSIVIRYDLIFSISPSHSFILDTENENIMNLFDKSDQEYIKTYNVVADPELKDDLIEYLLTYVEVSIILFASTMRMCIQ